MINFSLRGDATAAGEARERLSTPNSQLRSGVERVLMLLVTELVTNAVRHGGAGDGNLVEVTVIRSPGRLTAAVTDSGPGFEWVERGPSRSLDTGGFGLLLVERMAQRWGIERNDESTTVWFELAHSDLSAKFSPGPASSADSG